MIITVVGKDVREMEKKRKTFIVVVINPILVKISFEIVLKSFYCFVIVERRKMRLVFMEIVRRF